MSNQIIKCDTAKVAKDKGFDLEVENFYENTGPMSGNILHDRYAEENYNDFDFKFHEDSICFSAPTQTALQTWLREVKKVRVYVTNSAAGEFKKAVRDTTYQLKGNEVASYIHTPKFDSSVLVNQFIPCAESRELRELGFNEPCFAAWMDNTEIPSMGFYPEQEYIEYSDGECLAPLWQQAFEFFRVKYAFESNVRQLALLSNKFWWHINFIDIKKDEKIKGCSAPSASHELAQLECLRKLIGLVKNGYKDLFHSKIPS